MNVAVSQDGRHPEGGYAVLRFEGMPTAVEGAQLSFQPLEEGGFDGERWPRGRIPAVGAQLRDGALEVVVGPEVVNALPAYAALQISLFGVDPRTGAEVDLRADCRWPALALRSQRRRGRLPEVKQPAVAEPLAPPIRVPPSTSSKAVDAEEPLKNARDGLKGPANEHLGRSASPQPVDFGGRLEPGTGNEVLETRQAPQGGTETETLNAAAPAFGRNAPAAAPARSRAGVLAAALVSLLLGLGLGVAGDRFLRPASTGGAERESTRGEANATSDRALMDAVDSADVTPDGKPIFRTSSEDFSDQAAQLLREGNFAAAALRYRMAVRVSLSAADIPALLEGGIVEAAGSTGGTPSEAANLGQFLLTLSALAGDSGAFCRLAGSYDAGDPDYAQRLRERARSLRSAGQAGESC